MLQQLRQDLNAVIREVQRLRRMEIEGYARRESSGGVSFGLGNNKTSPIRYPDKFVAIVRTPEDDDKTLRVRELKYQDPFPQPCIESEDGVSCRYAWVEIAFNAHPMFGSTVMDYKDDVLENGETLEAPPSDTTILRCFRNHDSWIVEQRIESGGAVIPVRVVAAFPDASLNETPETATRLVVQPLKLVEGAYVANGDTEPAHCWPNFRGRHYLPTIGINPSIVHGMWMIDGVPHVHHTMRWSMTTPQTTYPVGGCPIV